VRQLQHADLVVWIGPQLEGFLQKTLQGLPESVQRMSLLTLPHLNTLAVRRGGVWEADAHHESGTTETHHHHAHDEDEDQHTDKAASHSIDPHIWLDPENAQVIIQAIAAQLSQLDPDNAAIYQANAERATADISALDQALKTQLAPIQAQPFIVFHDAYHYFEQHYQLNAVGAISLSPEQQPSAQRLEEIRDRIKTAHVRCVFREPQFQPSLVTVVLENTPAQQGVLDPLGMTLTETGAALYRALLQHLADNLVACLQ
jgi:zinc transport system substrate-binding protein